MKEKILIVEDEYIVAYDLKTFLTKAGYLICGIASSVVQARKLIEQKRPDWVLLDITVKGNLTGIDLAWELLERRVPFLYISANINQATLEAVKATQPYGFMVKPFRERDLLVMLDIARYKHGLETGRIVASKRPEGAAVARIEGIIGHSGKLKEVLEKVAIVAPTLTSVLILGESGTGKERIAQAIHQLSLHRSKTIVTVNCGALPANLVESELFGHERGAFTGAHSRRIGKFEQADKGTIFLDEIGELPADAQAKLLRVLQEREIERVGGDHSVKVDVRVIASTNRNLEKEVAEGRFRLDLYYRLNVFPIELPPLRERREDIEDLANFFLRKFSLESRRNVVSISEKGLVQLQQYNWPGNIRELEHLIERSVLMATGNRLESFNLPEGALVSGGVEKDRVLKTMEEMEREHIMNALKASNGKVFGPGGAAEILNMPAATLYSKMKRLGIRLGYE